MNTMTRFDLKSERNLTMLVDFYELTMANGYLNSGVSDTIAYFDMFFRKIPDNGGYCIMAGVQQMIEYLSNLKFTKKDLDYLRSKNLFSEDFLVYLANFKFTCDVWAIPEGTVVFPGEPLVTVRGPIMEAQFVETMLLLTINHQTLIATKASRICEAAGNRAVMEFGSRRAQGYDGALYGARAAVIGGCTSTACTLADELFGTPSTGTMAHSWIQLFDNEYDSFVAWAKAYPDDTVLLVDTYNVLKSGIPNAIKAFDEILKPIGKRPKAIRIDSGDITYLSIEARKMLDEAGYEDVKITISNSLDEFIIKAVLENGAQIDSFGVGERLITARSEPVFGGVYKLVAIEKDGKIIPRIKISENVEKITNPGFKSLYRLYDNKTNKAIADLIALRDESFDSSKPIELFDPNYTWKKKKVQNYTIKDLSIQIFNKGVCTYESPSVMEIKDNCTKEKNSLWSETRRLQNPHKYYVDLSKNLWNIKESLLYEYSTKYDE